ncbi:MAG TPA: Nudix family hydrolase [Burkholderiales bacterium]|nr:Nudix family hydrolase [Burkholderiales bacterium]
MPEERRRIEVAAAVIHDAAGRFLLAQRPPGKAFEGYWEFPGGKVEPGESAAAAIRRELYEELGIEVDAVFPWLTRDFEYPHASVRLRFFRIYHWRGEPHGREGQRFAWQTSRALNVAPILPANGPILRALDLPAVYGITQAEALGMDVFKHRLAAALEQGLRLIQVREKNLPADVLRAFAADVVALSHRHDARVLINGDVELARETGADGVHLTAAQTRMLTQRPACEWVAASCHDRAEIEVATCVGVDFVVVGPVMTTPTHPGMPVLGWDGLAACVQDTVIPVYALGGMRQQDVEMARQSGAQGVAMLRGAWC